MTMVESETGLTKKALPSGLEDSSTEPINDIRMESVQFRNSFVWPLVGLFSFLFIVFVRFGILD